MILLADRAERVGDARGGRAERISVLLCEPGGAHSGSASAAQGGGDCQRRAEGKGYDSADFVAELRRMCVTPHVAAKAKSSVIDGRTTRHAGYAVSQRKRKQIEEPFGCGKTVGQLRKTMLRGLARVGAQFALNMAA
jgi:hypothetical protein